MKNLLIIIFVFILFKTNYAAFLSVKMNFKKSITTSYNVQYNEEGKPDKSLIGKTIILADDIGNVTESININKDGSTNSKREYKYNDKEKIVTVTRKDLINSRENDQNYKYDKYGNIVESEVLLRNSTKRIFKNSFNNNKDMVKTSAVNENGELFSETIFTYDKYNNLKSSDRITYNSTGSTTNTTICSNQYDKNNNLLQHSRRNKKGIIAYKYKYNEKKQLLKKLNYGYGGSIKYQVIYEYDNIGNEVSTKHLYYTEKKVTSFRTTTYEY